MPWADSVPAIVQVRHSSKVGLNLLSTRLYSRRHFMGGTAQVMDWPMCSLVK